MSRFPFVKAFSLLLFLFVNTFGIQLFAQTETSLTLKNNTDSAVFFCLNDVYKSTLLPKSQTVSNIPTGSQKIDLVAVSDAQKIGCSFNYGVVDTKGLPAHDDYADTFYDYEDYFYTLNQTSKSVTTTSTSYQLATPIPTLGITAVDLSAISINSGFSNSQLCVDNVLVASNSANLVTVTPENHKFQPVVASTSSCVDSDLTTNIAILNDNTYKYNEVTNNLVTNQLLYIAVADFKVKPQAQKQNTTPDISTPVTQNSGQIDKNIDDSKIPETKKDTEKDQKIPEKIPDIIKYSKLTIDRASKDSIEDSVQPKEDPSNVTISQNKNDSPAKNPIEWRNIVVITTLLYVCYDIMLYTWKKSRLRLAKINI
jgi:hypothetical protein